MQHSKQEERRAGFEPVGRQQRRHEHTASNFEFAERLPGDILSDSPSHSADGELRRQSRERGRKACEEEDGERLTA